MLPVRSLFGFGVAFRVVALVSVIFAVAFALAGCGEKTTQAPPKQLVMDTVRASLPPFLSLDSIELEPIPTGPEAVKVNFKVTVTPKEDLYQVDREVEGTPRVTLLKVVQAAGAKVSLYGFVEAHRTMDLWTLGSPEIKIGRGQFGEPRGTFHAQSYVTGSKEAGEALRQQAINAAELERAKKADLEQREREQKTREEQKAREARARQEQESRDRIALEEQRKMAIEEQEKDKEKKKQEEAAARQQLVASTLSGIRYIGTITSGDERQRIRLVFTEQKNLQIRAEASCPEARFSDLKRTFWGELIFEPVRDKDTGVAYGIALSPAQKTKHSMLNTDSFYMFYNYDDVTLKLCLTNTGLEGVAKVERIGTTHYTIHLERETPRSASAPVSPPGSGSSPGRRPDGILPLPPPGPPASPPAPSRPAPSSP